MQFDATTMVHHKPLLERANCEPRHIKDERIQLLGHLHYIESHCATWHKSCRIRQNQTEPAWITYKRKLSRPKSSKRTGSVFQTAKRIQYIPFEKSLQRRRVQWLLTPILRPIRSVIHQVCYLNVTSKLITIVIITLGAKYHLSCLAVLVNCTRQHNNGKQEKRNCQSSTYFNRVDFPQTKF